MGRIYKCLSFHAIHRRQCLASQRLSHHAFLILPLVPDRRETLNLVNLLRREIDRTLSSCVHSAAAIALRRQCDSLDFSVFLSNLFFQLVIA